MDASDANTRAAAFGLEKVPSSLDDLPPPDTRRWVIRRKAAVVCGVESGLLTLDQACHRYDISVEEFQSWRELLERHGIGGLRVTRLGEYRNGEMTEMK